MAFHPGATSHSIVALVPKLSDPDADIRYMSLSDLTKMLSTAPYNVFSNDLSACTKLVDGLVKALDDTNGEVQNQSLKCLEPLASKAPAEALGPMLEKLVTLKPENSMDSSIPATALRTLILALPHPIQGVPENKSVQDAFEAIGKVLIPRLLGYVVIPQGSKGVSNPISGMLEIDPQRGADPDALEVLIELLRYFGPMLRDQEKLGFQTKLLQILDDKKTTNLVKKKAVTGLSVLAIYLTDTMLDSLMSKLLEGFRVHNLQPKKRRLLITVLGSLGRSIPSRVGRYLPNLVPYVLRALSQAELVRSLEAMGEDGTVDSDSEEVKEAALVTLEALLSSCSPEMRDITTDVIDVGLRYLTYDPALATEDDDEEMDMVYHEGDENAEVDDQEEDFEEEAGMSDDEDGSWKIRRCAAKVLHAVISAHNVGDEPSTGRIFERVAPVLVKAFKEREESVRLEILVAMAMLVKKAGEDPSVALLPMEEDVQSTTTITKSRKRRRGGSDDSMFDAPNGGSPSVHVDSRTGSPAPPPSPKYDLSKYSPTILSGASKLLLSKSLPTIQASTTFLRDFSLLQPGGLSDHLDQVIPRLIDLASGSGSFSLSMMNGASGGVSSNTITLRIDCLRLLATICDTHNTKALASYTAKMATGLLLAVKDSYFKVSCEALRTVESFVVAITPIELSGIDGQVQQQLPALSDAVVERIVSPDSDLEVRQRAIHTLGTMLGRSLATASNNSFTEAKQRQALETLYDRLKLEITRLDSVQAIDTVAASLGDKVVLQEGWVRKVCLELAAQLRKADRILRGASLRALRRLLGNFSTSGQLDDMTIQQLAQMLLPLITPDGLDLLSPSLDSLANLAKHKPMIVVNQNLNNAICAIVLQSLSGHTMESFLLLIRAVGESGAGQPLMGDFLQKVGVNGDPATVGAAIGTLLVSGGSTIGIRIDDFTNELRTAQDDKRKCLALSVLGEASLRYGTASPIVPATFTDQFLSKSERVCRAAAAALGRAGAGNVSKYVPIVLGLLDHSGNKQYLLLHSIKELLQYAGKEKADISSYTPKIWEKLLDASAQEDNKAVGAECIGRLIGVEPRKYLPILQTCLQDNSESLRSTAIAALRFAVTAPDSDLDSVLRPLLVPMLVTMLNDESLENRRAALTTLNSATNNKPTIILPNLSKLLPFVMNETFINPRLIREVQMGPFKHKVDDGLEIRKASYETLNALLDTAFARLSPVDLYERLLAGLADDHDIKILCVLMVTKLLTLAPDETLRRLDALGERFQAILTFKPKDNAVKQELEKLHEANKAVLRVSVRLMHAFSRGNQQGGGAAWKGYCEFVQKDHRHAVAGVEAEIKVQGV